MFAEAKCESHMRRVEGGGKAESRRKSRRYTEQKLGVLWDDKLLEKQLSDNFYKLFHFL